MAVTATLRGSIDLTQTGGNDYDDKLKATIAKTISLTDGTAANNADLIFVDQRTVATATNDDIDLAGSLTDAFGVTITFAEIVAVLVINGPISGSANTTDLTIGAGSNPFVGFLGGTAPTIGPIKPGGVFMIFAGDAAGVGTVTAGTGDILRIANSSGASATYQICIIGRSA
jgi:hypothetical protein